MNLFADIRRLLPLLIFMVVAMLPVSNLCVADSAVSAKGSGKSPRILLESTSLRLKGGAAFSDGNGVRSIRITGGGWGEVDPEFALTGREGTLSLRVNPLWKGAAASHPFLSMRWGDAKGGYLVLSQGWWEPTGADRLYFVLNNEEFAHCSAPIEIARGEWSEITVSWRSGPAGFCRLYVNGDRVAESRLSLAGDFQPRGPLFLGSDRGTSLARGRRADALIAGLKVWDDALSDGEIERLFTRGEGEEARARERKASWNRRLLERGVIPGPPRDAQGMLRENRVIFDEDMEWAVSREATDRVIATIKRAGFNVYIPCVWYGGNTLFPTPLAPMLPDVSRSRSKGDDPFAYLIEEAHRNGIEVHPWFQVARREGGAFPEFAGDGVPEGAYDVHNSRFRSFIVGLVSDVVRRYPVDGINLDYVRSMGSCSGKSCRDDYRRFCGRDLLADMKASPTGKEAAISIGNWHRRALGEIVTAISENARSLRPDIVVSVDSSLLSDFFLSQGNDAIVWANRGSVDVIFHMDYGRCPDWKTAAKARQQFQDGKRMVMLLAGFAVLDHGAVPFEGSLLADFVRLARAQKWGGVAFYHRPRLSGQQVDVLAGTVFREGARTLWPQ